MKERAKTVLKAAFGVALYIIGIILIWQLIASVLVDKEAVRVVVSEGGVLAPILFILIQIVQNIVAPIAHYPVLIAGGFIFATVKGFLFNWIGTAIGTILVILFARRFGRPLVQKMVSRKFIRKYDRIVKKMSPFGLFMLYFLPGFPDDEISYLVGLSDMPTRDIIIATILGKTGGATLSFIGDDPVNGTIPMIVANAILLGVFLLYYFHKRIVRFFQGAITKS